MDIPLQFSFADEGQSSSGFSNGFYNFLRPFPHPSLIYLYSPEAYVLPVRISVNFKHHIATCKVMVIQQKNSVDLFSSESLAFTIDFIRSPYVFSLKSYNFKVCCFGLSFILRFSIELF